MQTDIHEIIEIMRADPKGISNKFNIPLRTVYSWCSGERRPPDYIINMMHSILILEGRLNDNGNGKKELGSGMEVN